MHNIEDIQKDLDVITNCDNVNKWAHFGAKNKGTYLNKINIKYPDRPKGTHLKVYLEILSGKYTSKQERSDILEKGYYKDYYENNKEKKTIISERVRRE